MLGNAWDGESTIRIMRSVVEEGEARATSFLEIQNVESRGALVKIVTVAARIKSKQRTDQQPYRGFVRDNDDGFAGGFASNLQQRGQCARRHGQAALATLW